MAEKVINRFIEEELKTSYLNYAMSVIVQRALPDVRDGLKPVHRRILFGLHRLGMTYNRPYKKCATVVGEVLGKYHPHGDQAIYDTLVRLAQEFSMRHMLVDGQGNFGSIDGDNAAAMRYTECRMARISEEMLRDIQKETIDYQNNFDDTLKEPMVLPAAFPNLLVNGVSGIAVGMATNMAPHNLVEVIDGVIAYIDNNDITVEELMHFVKGPDFPTRGIIYGMEGIKKAYKTGRGHFKIRSRVSIEEYKKDREALIVTEIPYQVNKAEMIKKMADLVKSDHIKGISEIRDESDKDGIRVVIELKRAVATQTILNQLYKHTNLETSYSINNVALVNKQPRTLNLKELVLHFSNHRFEVHTRRIRFDLRKAEERAHILEGLIKAVDNIDEVVRIIRASKSVSEAKETLMSTFSFTEVQAQAILDMRLARLVALEIEKLRAEFQELLKFIAECKDLLANPHKIYDLIKEELERIKTTFGNERKTEINIGALEELDIEDYIQKANVVISLTKSGYIKRSSVQLYRQQNRGGVGVRGANINKEDDIVDKLFVATTHDTVMFISNLGKAYYMKTHEIPEASRTAKGSHTNLLLNLSSGETLQSVFVFDNFETAKNFIMVTAKGMAKKLQIKDLINAKKRGVQAFNLKDGDTLVGAVEVSENQDIFMGTRKGYAMRTSEEQFRVMGRSAGGVRAMTLDSSDEIVGLQAVHEEHHLLVVSENGVGKRIRFEEFSQKGRGIKGQIYMKTSDKTGEICTVSAIADEDNVLFMTSSGNMIRLNAKDISILGRTAQGVRLVNVKEPDMVVDAAVIRPLDED